MVGVIIPVFRARETLPRALDSLVAQTKKSFLVTLVQDCDGEDYSDIIEEYKRRGLKLYLIQMEENVGPGLARQKGIDANKMCEYVMFLDADDMYFPQTVEVLSREISINKANIASSTIIAELPKKPELRLEVQTTPSTWCHAKIYRRQYLIDNDIRFHPELRLNEDSYFNLVAVNATDKRIQVPKETYLWCYNKNSLTRSKDDEETFFARGWDQYIKSQVYGLEKLYSLTTIPDPLIGATLINIYDHYMKAIHKRLDLDKVKDAFYRLAHLEPLWKQMDNKGVWTYINANLHASAIEDETMYFYKMRFIDWIKEVKTIGGIE